MCRSSESLKMPFLKTSFESLAPMLSQRGHTIRRNVSDGKKEAWEVDGSVFQTPDSQRRTECYVMAEERVVD